MSTIVYQQVQSSSYESYFVESRTLSLKLNSTKLSLSQTPTNSLEHSIISSKSDIQDNSFLPSNNSNSCSWSAIEALTSTKDTTKKDNTTYVHPLVKRSAFLLSEKSLEMCTESLGNETGTCDMETEVFSTSSTTTTTTLMRARKARQMLKMRQEVVVDQGKFPPPLTTISGSNAVKVTPYREDGRLIIKAISSPPMHSYMQAERSDGRLKLSFVRDDSSYDNGNDFGIGIGIDIDDDDDCLSSLDDDDEDDNYGIEGMDINGVESLMENNEQEQEKIVEDVDMECHKSDASYSLEDINGITVEFGVKLGLGKIQRSSRCKERGQGNKRLINLEPFWVAT